MCPSAEFVEGSELVLDQQEIALGVGWTEPAKGSSVTRIGSIVFLSMQVKNEAEPAYASGTTYAAKALVSESGKLYESIAGSNVGHTPSTDAGVHWKLLDATNDLVCTLPEQFWPAATTVTPDGKFSVSTAGVLTSTFALTSEAGTYVPLQLSYRAQVQTP